MSQGELFAPAPSEKPQAWPSGWYCIAYLDDTEIWRGISDLRRYSSLKSCAEDIRRLQPRQTQQLQAIPIEQAGEPASGA